MCRLSITTLDTMKGTTMSQCDNIPTLKQLQDVATNSDVLNESVTSDQDLTPTTATDGEQKKTLAHFERQYNEAIQAAGGVPLGPWAAGTTYNAYNEYQVYNGIPYKPATSTTLPYTTQGSDPTVAPDAGNVVPFAEVTRSDIVQNVASIPELLNVQPTGDGFKVNVTAYHGDWAATSDTPKGGGVFVWDSSRSKSDHNGGTIIDPDAPFPTLWDDTTQQAAWFDSSNGGFGCWVRPVSAFVSPYEFGAKGEGADDTQPLLSASYAGIIATDDTLVSTNQSFFTPIVGEGLVVYLNGDYNKHYVKQGNIGGSPQKNHFSIGCIPRCTDGVFDVLDDGGHAPMNVSSIDQPDDYTIQINYANRASKINTLLIQQDAELAPYGVDIGGDVGVTLANVRAFTNFNAYINGQSVNAHELLQSDTTASISNDQLVLSHEQSVANDVPVVSVVNKTPKNTLNISVGYSSTTTTVTALSDISGFIFYDGTEWQVSLTNNIQGDANITFSTPSFGTIKVNHAETPDENVMLTGHGTGYIVNIMSTDKNSFEIGFIDYNGVLITTPTTAMKCHFRLKALVKSAYPADMGVLVRRGNVKVKSRRFSDVPGNNFWVTGDFEI